MVRDPRRALLLSLTPTLSLASACTPSAQTPDEGTTLSSSEATSGSSQSDASDSSDSQSESSDSSSSESVSETETETETGDMCTGEVCSSTLTMHFDHSLPLLEGPHRLLITTPNNDIQCGIEAELEGAKSCFGFIFADLSWNEERITVTLTSPFYDTDTNPDGAPFISVQAELEREGQQLWERELPIDAGDSMQPDPCGPLCWQALAETTIELDP